MDKNIDTRNINPSEKTFSERKEDWDAIEELVMIYQQQFKEGACGATIKESQEAANSLLERFNPLIKKYIIIISTGQINFNDKETKAFVSAFLGDKNIRTTLKRRKQSAETRSEVYSSFNFVVLTYGQLTEEEIKSDLQILLLKLAKRYQVMGRSFCGYVATTFKFEVLRHIKKFLENPLNVPYRHTEYEDIGEGEANGADHGLEDSVYEDQVGLPDMSWVQGVTCSDKFYSLDPIERKVLVKYYLEDCNDREIAGEFGININTANKIRRTAAEKVADNVGLGNEDIIRSRKVNKSFNRANENMF